MQKNKIMILGAGYPRTGTMSLKFALEELTGGSCYHMLNFIHDTSSLPFWVETFKNKRANWEDLLSDFSAIVDFPASIFMDDLLRHYPDAKVILTFRDPEEWYQSMLATVLATGSTKNNSGQLIDPLDRENRSVMRGLIWDQEFKGRKLDKLYMIERYKSHLDQIKALVSPKNLLLYRISDGWGPICNFLGYNVPKTPFPKKNSRNEFFDVISKKLD